MTKLLLIGDLHGKWMSYNNIIKSTKANRSVQVGDFGIGFPYPRFEKERDNAWSLGDHKFIRGNHDAPAACKTFDSYISDMTYESDIDTFFIGGALSIDQWHRTAGIDWWEDEEMSFKEMQIAVDMYADLKPRIMVTHDAPESAADRMFSFYKKDFPSKTRQGFQSMLEIHQPELWVFGHWHNSVTTIMNNTKFVCLNELETLEVDV